MAILQSVGPAHLYVAPQTPTASPQWSTTAKAYPAASTIRYLGTCEAAPRILTTPHFKNVHADLWGGQEGTPADKIDLGEDAIISCVLTKWNELVFESLVARPNPMATAPGKAAASATIPARGKLMNQTGYTYSLWIEFPRNARFSAQYVPAGYRFPNSFVVGPDDYMIGTGPNKRAIIFNALSLYERKRTTSGTNYTFESHFLLYDSDFTYIPTIPPTAADGELANQVGDEVAEAGFGSGGWERPA